MQGAIFDMDGTLLDSMPAWRSQHAAFLRARALPVPRDLPVPLEDMTASAFLAHCKALHGLDITYEALLREYIARLQVAYATCVRAKPFALAYVAALRARGVRCCVLTATPAPIAQAALARLGFAQHFEWIAGTRDADIGVGKHDACSFTRAADKLGVPPTACTVFEDAHYAMVGAKAAGCRVIAIEDESARRERTAIRKTCDVYARSFQALLATLDDMAAPGE